MPPPALARPAVRAAREQALPHPAVPGRSGPGSKFRALADGVIAPDAQQAFLDAVTRLPELDADELAGLTLPGITEATQPTQTWGIL